MALVKAALDEVSYLYYWSQLFEKLYEAPAILRRMSALASQALPLSGSSSTAD